MKLLVDCVVYFGLDVQFYIPVCLPCRTGSVAGRAGYQFMQLHTRINGNHGVMVFICSSLDIPLVNGGWKQMYMCIRSRQDACAVETSCSRHARNIYEELKLQVKASPFQSAQSWHRVA